MKSLSLKNHSQLPLAAKQILSFAGEKKIFCFYGELGAGKTTLIKELCKQLGVKDEGSSPTFSLINEYHAPTPRFSPSPLQKETENRGLNETEKTASVIYHLDLYRLKSESEIYDIGYEDYLYSGNYCFIEWPEKMEHLLPPDVVKVRIVREDSLGEVNDGERIITLS